MTKMKVFVTGGTGTVGSAVIPELLNSGYEVIALARSDESADKMKNYGSKVKTVSGDLKDLEALKRGAAESDGVIHLAFIHDWENFEESSIIDRKAIEAMNSVLEGTNKPFISTSGVLTLLDKDLLTEQEVQNPNFPGTRPRTESIALDYKHKGVRAIAIRLATTVHGKNDKAFIPYLIKLAQEKGVSAYIGEGKNVWPAVNVADTASLYRLSLEKGKAGSVYHGIAEQGIETREIAVAIGELLGVPVKSVIAEKAQEHFGFLGLFFGANKRTSSKFTQEQLGWKPIHLPLLEDIKENYSSLK